MKLPNLPEDYFFRVTSLLGSPVVELHKKTFFGLSKRIGATYITNETPVGIAVHAQYLWDQHQERFATKAFIKKYTGDYPPKEL